jgi:phosphoglycerate dehydrogenase-like enzyme
VNVLYRGQVYEAELAALAARRGFAFTVAADADAVIRALPDADALWITPSTYDPAIPRAAAAAGTGRLRWMALTSAGYDAVIARGRIPNVVTTYASGVYAPVVAEHALALLLASVRGIGPALDAQRAATWDRALPARLRSLEDMTVAIVGFGAIGRALARLLRPLAARIVGVNRSGAADPLADAMFPAHAVHDALAQSDAVVLAVTLDDGTRGLIDAPAFAAMRPGAVLVNVARGPVVDAAALRDALASGHVYAALDVTDPEPLPPDDALWSAPGALITPHVGGFGSRAVAHRLVAHIERNVDRLLANETLEGVVP